MRTRTAGAFRPARALALFLLAQLFVVTQTSAAATVGLLVPRSGGFEKQAQADLAKLLVDAGCPSGHTTVFLQMPEDEKISRVQSIQKLLAQEVDLLVVQGAAAAREAAQANSRIPIVAIGVFDPVEDGLAASAEKPGKNVTGVVIRLPLQSLLQAMGETIPLRGIGVLYQSENSESVHDLTHLRALCAKLDYSLVELDLRKTREPELAAALGKTDFVVLTSGAVGPGSTLLTTLNGRFPIASRSPGIRENGVVFTQVPDLPAVLAAAARIAAGIVLKKTPPGGTPFSIVESSSFGIDLKESKRFNLHVPFSVLKEASHVSK